MQYSLVTVIALAATGVYARAVPQPVVGVPTLPIGGLDFTKVTDTLTQTQQNQKNNAATSQTASQGAGASATGADQTTKDQNNSCTAADGSKGSRFCCSPQGNTNTQTSTHSTTSSDDDKTQSDVRNFSEMTSVLQTTYNTIFTNIIGQDGNSIPWSRVTRRTAQSTAGSGGDTNSQGTVSCDPSDSCSTEQKNVCFLNGNQFNLGPVGPLIFQEAPQSGSSDAGTPPPPPPPAAVERS